MKPTEPPPHGPAGGRHDDGVAHHGDYDDALHNETVAHEHSDVDVRAIGTAAGIIAGVVAVSMVAMYLLFGWFERQALGNQPEISPLATPATQMPPTTRESPFFGPAGEPGVQLLTDEPMALRRHRASEQQRLQGYGWVDEAAGVAHIPVEEAMRLILERGLPVREFDTVEPTLGTRTQATGESSGGRMITGVLPHPADDLDDQPVDNDVQPESQPPAGKPQAPGGP